MIKQHPLALRAREWTPEELEQRREDMGALNDSIKGTIVEGRAVVWKLAEQLDRWDEESGWSTLGYEHLSDWLADPAIGITKSRYYALVGNYRELKMRRVDASELRALDPSKVEAVMPAVKAKRFTLETALADARDLSRAALRDKYAERESRRRDSHGPTPASPTTDDPPVPSASESVPETVSKGRARHALRQALSHANDDEAEQLVQGLSPDGRRKLLNAIAAQDVKRAEATAHARAELATVGARKRAAERREAGATLWLEVERDLGSANVTARAVFAVIRDADATPDQEAVQAIRRELTELRRALDDVESAIADPEHESNNGAAPLMTADPMTTSEATDAIHPA